MTVLRRSRSVVELIISTRGGRKRPIRTSELVAIILAIVVATSPSTLAQISPEIRDRVIPAAVQIAIIGEVTENGVTGPLALPVGSGTIVSASGQIVTAGHVVDMTEHRRMLDSWEAQAAAAGQSLAFVLDLGSVLIATSDGISTPQPRYTATIVASDPALDLAVLQIVGDESSRLIDPASLNLPFVPLGDSDTVALGDAVDMFGYPGIAGGALTYTEGVVSAFNAEGPIGRAWIITDAVASGGSSGGTAVNRQGALIGILTGGSIECRPGDLNGDGRIDAQDVGCRVVGGSLAKLRPSNLARDLLTRAGTTGPSAPGGQDRPPGPAELPQPPEPGPVPSLPDMLLDELPLEHAGCFRIENDRVLTFEDLIANFGSSEEARTRLQNWGWRASANRIFACDTPPEGEAGWIDMSLHLFADSSSAQQAVDYFAAVRAEGSPLISAAPPEIGDHAAVLSGPATNGKEFTLYVSRGPMLVRVTGVSPSGIPFINVLTVAQSILALPVPQVQPDLQTSSLEGVSQFLPESLPLSHASCFRVDDIVTFDFPAIVARFPGTPDASERLEALGWETGAYRQFECAAPPAGHVNWIDISIHRFGNAASAEKAVPFFAQARTVGTQLESAPARNLGDRSEALAGPSEVGTEYTLYVSSGRLLVRITGVAPIGDPGAAVEQVMHEILTRIGDLTGTAPQAIPTQAPPAAIPVPTTTPLPTAMPVPTATPTPTSTPVPTSTPLPLPTATSTPTPVPSPTATAIPTPTPMPLSTATTVPTPTPRAVVLIPVATATLIPVMLPTTAPEPTATPLAASAQPTLTRDGRAGCELVELYPGYPGYRGYVTGIDGPGEVACLDDLIVANPRFDKATEDAANQAAAQSIGLTGSPTDWTWENWMAIEAERGLVPTCYSCLFQDLDPPPSRKSAEWDSTDPRLQMGGYGTSDALFSAVTRAGLELNMVAFYEDKFDPDDQDALGPDHVLRAVIGLQWQGHHTAPEMLDAYDQLFAFLSEPGLQFIDVSGETVLAQGGYAPTPPTAHIEDQVYMIRMSAEAMCAAMPEDTCTAWLGQYDAVEVAFLNEVLRSGPDVSYAEWIREEVPALFLF